MILNWKFILRLVRFYTDLKFKIPFIRTVLFLLLDEHQHTAHTHNTRELLSLHSENEKAFFMVALKWKMVFNFGHEKKKPLNQINLMLLIPMDIMSSNRHNRVNHH